MTQSSSSHPARKLKSILSFTFTPHNWIKVSTLINSTIKTICSLFPISPVLLHSFSSFQADLAYQGSTFPHLNQVFLLLQGFSLLNAPLMTRFSCGNTPHSSILHRGYIPTFFTWHKDPQPNINLCFLGWPSNSLRSSFIQQRYFECQLCVKDIFSYRVIWTCHSLHQLWLFMLLCLCT